MCIYTYYWDSYIIIWNRNFHFYFKLKIQNTTIIWNVFFYFAACWFILYHRLFCCFMNSYLLICKTCQCMKFFLYSVLVVSTSTIIYNKIMNLLLIRSYHVDIFFNHIYIKYLSFICNNFIIDILIKF